MQNFIVNCLVNMLGLYAASLLFPAITATSPAAIMETGLVLGIINLFLRPLLLLLCLPLNIITLGLFTLVINTWLLLLADWCIPGLNIPSFVLAFAAAFLITALQAVIRHLFLK